MAMKLNPPVFASKDKSFERWKIEVSMWTEVTDLKAEKQGMAVALSLPDSDPSGIRELVMEEITLTDLKTANGLTALLDFMEKKLGKDDMEDSLEKFEDFKNCRRAHDQNINAYIHEFEQRYNRIMKKNIKLPQEILCFELLSSANISKQEKMLVLSGVDFAKKDNLFEQAKKSLKKFKGDIVQGGGVHTSSQSSAIKLEPAFLAENEEALAAAGYYKPRGRGGQFYGNSANRRGTGRFVSNASGRGRNTTPDYTKPMNPKGRDGKLLTCHACGSYRHLIAKCPDSYENAPNKNVHVTETEEKVVLFTGYDKKEIKKLGLEAKHCAVLDTACTSTVCGKEWLECFLASLSRDKLNTVKKSVGTKVFKFGGGETLKSEMQYTLPCVLAGQEVTIVVDVVDSNIPLLLSLKSLKAAKVKLDLETDTAEIFGIRVPLNFTSSGHYCISVDGSEEVMVEEVNQVRLDNMSCDERIKTLTKLHRQFAHPSMSRLENLLKDAEVWDEDYRAELQQVYQNCETCKLYTRTPSRPVVSMPLAHSFNDKVAMDLKVRSGEYILHLVDMFSRMSISVFIKRKYPSEVLEKIMTHWIGAGWGVMKAIFFDNGGEFSNDEIREVASILNVQVWTTPAESPWSNGLCERNHQITDRMLEILEEENPDTDSNTLLLWANVAKNSLQMWNGFSSYQLVLGQNPNLPNIMSEKLPALVGTTTSEVLRKHLNALHSARLAFIRCEADERIRRALRHKIRAVDERFEPGDVVYYKRDGSNRWLGPAKVIFQDGRLVFVRHGGIYVRVSTNRLIKDGKERDDTDERDNIRDRVNNDTGNGVKQNEQDDVHDTNNNVKARTQSDTSIGNAISDKHLCEVIGGQPVVHTEDITMGQPRANVFTLNKRVKNDDVIEYKISDSDEWIKARIIGRAGKATSATKGWYNIEDVGGNKKSIDLDSISEWRKMDEPHALEDVNAVMIPHANQYTEECMQAKEEELLKLKKFDVYEEVLDVGQVCVSTTWVVTRKKSGVKARLVARGFEESDVPNKDSPTFNKSTLRILLSIAASNNWTIKSVDIMSAFLQGRDMTRDVYVKPPREADCPQGKVWKLKKCLYGLVDAARQFYDSVKEEMLKLTLKQSQVDPAMFYLLGEEGRLCGMVITHIDDFLYCGNDVFEQSVINKLTRRFIAGSQYQKQFTYVGFDITQETSCIVVSQEKYANELWELNPKQDKAHSKDRLLSTDEITQYRGIVGKLNWTAQGTRPDMAFEVMDLSTKFKSATVGDFRRACKDILKLKRENSVLCFPNLGSLSCWKLIVMSDAALANMHDGVSSVGAHIVFLIGRDNHCCIVGWACNKVKRVVKSTLAAEMLSLSQAVDHSIFLKHMLLELTGLTAAELPIGAFVDNKSVVDAVYSTRAVDDKRLRIDCGALKQNIECGDINWVKWIPGENMLANVLTKKGASSSLLLQVIQHGKFHLEV